MKMRSNHFFRAGGVPIRSQIRALKWQARMSSIIRLLWNWVKQSRGAEACEELAVAACGFAFETERVFAGSLPGEGMCHVHEASEVGGA
jgi:hypothetical protein